MRTGTDRTLRTHAGRRLRRGLAAAALLAYLSPMTFSLAGCTVIGLVAAVATRPKPRVIPAGDALHLEPGVKLWLDLEDGTSVSGRFVGRTLLSPEAYAPRFTRRSAVRPIALGETLQVALADGRTVRGTFRGYAVRALVLRGEDARDVRVLFDSTREVRLQAGRLVAVDSLRGADERGELPLLEALAIEPADRTRAISARPGIRESPGPLASRIASALHIPFEDIRGTTVRTERGMRTGYIVLGLVVDVLVVVITVAAVASSYSGGCNAGQISLAQAGPPVHWTERPFDTRLARFVDEWDAAPDLASLARDPAAVTAAPMDSSAGTPARGASIAPE